MNELDLIKESLQSELKNPQNYEHLIQQSASNIANLLILKPVFDTLGAKIEDLKKRNLLKKNYKKILKSNLIELLKMLDDPNLSEENVLLIERLIILNLSKNEVNSSDLISKEFLKIAKMLNSSEIVIMEAAFKNINKKHKDIIDIDDVYNELCKSSGLKYKELVIKNISSLTYKKLVKSQFQTGQISNSDSNYIFTDLGKAFIEYLTQPIE